MPVDDAATTPTPPAAPTAAAAAVRDDLSIEVRALLDKGRLYDACSSVLLASAAAEASAVAVPASTYHAVIEACCAGGAVGL